jgi:hypothetical protein
VVYDIVWDVVEYHDSFLNRVMTIIIISLSEEQERFNNNNNNNNNNRVVAELFFLRFVWKGICSIWLGVIKKFSSFVVSSKRRKLFSSMFLRQ